MFKQCEHGLPLGVELFFWQDHQANWAIFPYVKLPEGTLINKHVDMSHDLNGGQ